jgi:hypothetical protein
MSIPTSHFFSTLLEQIIDTGESMIPERQAAPTQGTHGTVCTLPPLTRDQVDACCHLHRRSRLRADVIRRLLEPDPARDEMMEVIMDMLVEIRGATEALDTLIHNGRPDPRS